MADEKKETKKASGNVSKLVDEISKLSVLELSELVEELKEKLGVSGVTMAAAAPMTAAGAAAEGQEAATDEGGNKTVVMTAVDTAKKIAVIKALREINQNLGLKEAKDMTEQVPAEVLKDAKAEEAKEASEKLKAAGATVELK
jgi:large subunit ribosomal protein L7/L12